MESIEHSLRLKDGRILAYHTFPGAKAENACGTGIDDPTAATEARTTPPERPHPVLYFHGFPGCGAEGGVHCARSVALAGGELFAIDRPGMGRTSSPYVSRHPDGEGGSNLCALVDSVWELVADRGWEDFSVIGVSGGGPYALALLASYLERTRGKPAGSSSSNNNNNSNIPQPHLRNVSLVGAICLAAGTEGIETGLGSIVPLVEAAPFSFWSRLFLRTNAVLAGGLFRYLLPWVPVGWAAAANSYATSGLPASDREWLSEPGNLGPYLVALGDMAARGGYPGIYDDQSIVLQPFHPHEEVLKGFYGGCDDSSSSSLPSAGIFQGAVDANVPASHARHLHEFVFCERSELLVYEGLGHVSLIAGKAGDYSSFATKP